MVRFHLRACKVRAAYNALTAFKLTGCGLNQPSALGLSPGAGFNTHHPDQFFVW